MKQLAILCPSRNRPGTCKTMIQSVLKSCTADVIVYVDEDDEQRSAYFDVSQDFKDEPRVSIYFGEHIGRGQAINALCKQRKEYRMYLVISDDVEFVRNDWEQQVVAAMDSFGDDIGVVHLESENGKAYVNWACVSRKWIDKLGFFNAPGMTWFCQDSVIQILGEALDRIKFITPQVIHHKIENHPNVMDRFHEDVSNFLWYMVLNFKRDLDNLKEAIRENAG